MGCEAAQCRAKPEDCYQTAIKQRSVFPIHPEETARLFTQGLNCSQITRTDWTYLGDILYITQIKYHTGSSVPTAVLLYNCVHTCIYTSTRVYSTDIVAVPAPLNHPRSGLQALILSWCMLLLSVAAAPVMATSPLASKKDTNHEVS